MGSQNGSGSVAGPAWMRGLQDPNCSLPHLLFTSRNIDARARLSLADTRPPEVRHESSEAYSFVKYVIGPDS